MRFRVLAVRPRHVPLSILAASELSIACLASNVLSSTLIPRTRFISLLQSSLSLCYILSFPRQRHGDHASIVTQRHWVYLKRPVAPHPTHHTRARHLASQVSVYAMFLLGMAHTVLKVDQVLFSCVPLVSFRLKRSALHSSLPHFL